MKTAMVIGASSGIGYELAKILADNNYKVAIAARRLQKLNELKREDPDKFITCELDICDEVEFEAKLYTLARELGGLDLLVLTSGIGDENPQLNLHIENKTIYTNVLGFTAVCNWAYLYFQSQKQGHLVAISSIAGLRGSRLAPAYNASKAFQINYLEGLAQKACRENKKIIITDVRAGLIDTAMAKGEVLFWIMPLKKATDQIWTAIIKKKRKVYVTRRWWLIAVLLKVLPFYLYKKI